VLTWPCTAEGRREAMGGWRRRRVDPIITDTVLDGEGFWARYRPPRSLVGGHDLTWLLLHWSPDRFYTLYSGPGVHGDAITEDSSHVGITLLAPDLAAQVDPSVDTTGRGPFDVIDYPLNDARTALAVARARHPLPFTDWNLVPRPCPPRPVHDGRLDPEPARIRNQQWGPLGSGSYHSRNRGLLA
jgi:hypothetical protein